MPAPTTLRPPTPEERALLTRPAIPHFRWSTGIVASLCAAALAFLIVLLVAPPWGAPAAGAAAVLAGLGWYLRVQARERGVFQAHRNAQARDAGATEVRSTVYTIRDAIAVKEQEDEGASFYLLLDDGRTLFLSGQYLFDAMEQGFPWQSFELVELPKGGWVLAVTRKGPPLVPSLTRAPFTDAEYDDGSIPEDRAVLSVDFETWRQAAE